MNAERELDRFLVRDCDESEKKCLEARPANSPAPEGAVRGC